MIGSQSSFLGYGRGGNQALSTTDLLSPNMLLLVLIGTPRYMRVYLKSMLWSVAILGATNSDPKVAVSTVACVENLNQVRSDRRTVDLRFSWEGVLNHT